MEILETVEELELSCWEAQALGANYNRTWRNTYQHASMTRPVDEDCNMPHIASANAFQ